MKEREEEARSLLKKDLEERLRIYKEDTLPEAIEEVMDYMVSVEVDRSDGASAALLPTVDMKTGAAGEFRETLHKLFSEAGAALESPVWGGALGSTLCFAPADGSKTAAEQVLFFPHLFSNSLPGSN